MCSTGATSISLGEKLGADGLRSSNHACLQMRSSPTCLPLRLHHQGRILQERTRFALIRPASKLLLCPGVPTVCRYAVNLLVLPPTLLSFKVGHRNFNLRQSLLWYFLRDSMVFETAQDLETFV